MSYSYKKIWLAGESMKRENIVDTLLWYQKWAYITTYGLAQSVGNTIVALTLLMFNWKQFIINWKKKTR